MKEVDEENEKRQKIGDTTIEVDHLATDSVDDIATKMKNLMTKRSGLTTHNTTRKRKRARTRARKMRVYITQGPRRARTKTETR